MSEVRTGRAPGVPGERGDRTSRNEVAPGPGADVFRHLFETTPDPILLCDPDTGVFVDANGAAMGLLRCGSRERLVGRRPADWSPDLQPEGRPSRVAVAEWMEETTRVGGLRFEWTVRCGTGDEVPVEVVATRIPMWGRWVHVWVARDITERRRAEVALLESQAVLASVTNNISEAIYRSDSAHRLIIVNRAYLRIFGYASLGEIQEVSPERLYAEPEVRQRLLGMLESEGSFNQQEVEYVRRDGSRFWGLTSARVIRDGMTGEVAYHVGAITDITERRMASEEIQRLYATLERRIEERTAELSASEAKFRALFEASSQGVILHDTEQYLEVNPAAVRLLGFESAEDLIGLHPKDTSPPTQPDGRSSAEAARAHITECMERGSTRFEWISRTGAGEDRPVEVILTRIEMRGRQIIQAVLNDISERKRAEEELRRALEREKELGKLKSNFVSMVSHEFRTPLGIIMSSAGILEKYFDRLTPEDRNEQLESIQRNTRRMGDLMEEVLLLARLDAGRMRFQPAPLDLGELCRSVVSEIRALTGQRCPIHVDLDLPGVAGSADGSLVRQILTNLLSNAVKYSDAGVAVDLVVRREGTDAVCAVRDRGIGIPESDRPWLFQAFHRGQNVGQRSGTGLGLVIVQRCVELHGGSIEVASEVGSGTTMTVRLPFYGGVGCESEREGVEA